MRLYKQKTCQLALWAFLLRFLPLCAAGVSNCLGRCDITCVRLYHFKDFIECFFVGDTDTDMITASRAGMYGVGATWGFRQPDELIANGAKALIDQPEQLLELIDHF